ncbi:hypothetical protein [Halomarina oriensis]|uniref:CHAT domain-containing protein n=1 Tax=Halomarina oriensis TaxID=671145 RepID=A0A6B0GWM3_9EURY|nr:hypothetical protein [Halomarina oriensis]MWG36545.1 hypothetical protein [Halomarina oriensis]
MRPADRPREPTAELVCPGARSELRLHDVAEGVRALLGADGATSCIEHTTAWCPYPLDSGWRVDTGRLSVPKPVEVVIRTGAGDPLTQVTHRERFDAEAGEYVLQVQSLGIVCYLHVTGTLTTVFEDGARIIHTSADHIDIGLRSLHERPHATVETSAHPRDLMRALSCFGSALKTTSPERSWPTLRGFPPALDVVDAERHFNAPEGLERTSRPIHLTVPEERRYVLPVASLAYYLDAPVTPGDPALHVGAESIPIRGPVDETVVDDVAHARFESGCRRLLEQVFTLDCHVRSAGQFPALLAGHDAVADLLSPDPETLYAADRVQRLDAYLGVDYEALADTGAIPQWKLTADLAPHAEHVPYLPFGVYDLGHVRTVELPADGEARPSHSASGHVPIVTPPPVESIEHAWLGPGIPLGASTPTPAACRRQLDPVGDGPVEIAVIVNDESMAAERSVGDIYEVRDLLAMDVTVHEGLTVAETRAVLEADRSLVHFVGHVTDEGLQCRDGSLDARTLDTLGARAFILNACRSYQQGRALLDAGAVGGLVTLASVANDSATRIGIQAARLLTAGFSLAGALAVLRETLATATQYSIVGDGNATIATTEGATPHSITLTRSGDAFDMTFYGYPTRKWPLGTTHSPNIGTSPPRCLNAGRITSITVTAEELTEYFGLSGNIPVRYNGQLEWAHDLGTQLSER